jgi:hypothetical protein
MCTPYLEIPLSQLHNVYNILTDSMHTQRVDLPSSSIIYTVTSLALSTTPIWLADIETLKDSFCSRQSSGSIGMWTHWTSSIPKENTNDFCTLTKSSPAIGRKNIKFYAYSQVRVF